MDLSILKELRINIKNIPGFRTHRKLVIFESDDWGSIRMPSMKTFNYLQKEGLDLIGHDALRYNLNDTLETYNDLQNLFEILTKYKDHLHNYPVFTILCVVANPDFKKIRESGFSNYFYESITDTMKRYKGCEQSFSLYKVGMKYGIFCPQMHGREHLNVTAWMQALRNGDYSTRIAFNNEFWGFLPNQKLLPGVDFQAAFLPTQASDIEYHKATIKEGLFLFENLFGFRAKYFVAPNGVFNNSLNKTLAENGIKYRLVSKIQNEPKGNGKSRKVIHWLGQKEKNGIRYINRNCIFEPNQPGKDWVDSCLNDINISFKWHKPAVISSHRVNYIGSLNPSNRDKGLRQLDLLLKAIINNWPDVTFCTTPELGKILSKS